MSVRGFSLVELLVVLGILGTLSTVALVSVFAARTHARDEARKTQLNLIRRVLASSACYAPDGGAGDYDLKTVVDELVAADPAAARFVAAVPKDPRLGTVQESGYRYVYGNEGHCALYANLEDANEEVTLPDLTEPTPGGGTGVLQASGPGPNGSDKYYQVSR